MTDAVQTEPAPVVQPTTATNLVTEVLKAYHEMLHRLIGKAGFTDEERNQYHTVLNSIHDALTSGQMPETISDPYANKSVAELKEMARNGDQGALNKLLA
jgi:hypothetical protein